ncbi:LysR family transcriptional regulator [Geodermatophilus sp. YIM 151500]|uniref:LysR family transcriptional regulator n=1 Tax=Geodermatophilus sp. YIM 151500 TaxID=2984531 RepID=UPI0021E3B310|nr:LysR family transcriptional regulator [Geodermatophilus sp. YIM 151500]MCV2490777.1 LysR family transcriptional regulator [Geodermatophilus sp. YIM 151500]
MDVRQLAYFLAVVETMNVGRAAEQLHIAQPSLSQAIGTLERELGVPLFHRVGRGIVLSDAGAQLVEPARQVVRDLEAARAAARSTREFRRGRVELVAMPSPGMEPLATLVRDFTAAHPAMTVTADAAFTPEEVVQAVKAGRAELGLLGAASPPHTGGLRVLPIEEQPLVLVSPPGDDAPEEPPDAAGRRTATREDLAGVRLVVSTEGSLMRRMVDDVLASGVDARIVVEVEHRTSILPLVLAGVGHAVLPSSWTPLARRSGARVRRIEPAVLLRIALVSRTGTLTPAAEAFVACVQDYVTGRRTPDRQAGPIGGIDDPSWTPGDGAPFTG